MTGIRGLLLLFVSAAVFAGALSYDRPPARKNFFLPRPKYFSSTSPEQVHISLVGVDKMRISWITKGNASATVEYGTSPWALKFSATGTPTSYRYVLYKSGQIHHAVIGPLKPSTVYYYRCSCDSTRQFNFKTPPPHFPIKFAIVGDIGQTGWTNSTLQHIEKSNYDIMLLPGDMSYADTVQPLWDSFGRVLEPYASQRPWMVTEGNHEIETISLVHVTPFTAYNARWRMPFEESGSTSNLYYSFNIVGVHVIMLGSYTDFNTSSDQYKWLQADLAKIDRKRTPWIVVNIHAPWYNSNTAHQGEIECVDMKKYMEELIYNARVDVVFAAHVHAYERFARIYNGSKDKCGAVHITVGDGGNREGLASDYIDPTPEISIFREASFGHAEFEVVNATHAVFTWHRNQDEEAVVADSLWLKSLSSEPACKM